MLELFGCADLLATQWGTEQRGEDAEIEQTCDQRQQANDGQDDPAQSVNNQ